MTVDPGTPQPAAIDQGSREGAVPAGNSNSRILADSDAALFDLDGVIYRGPELVPYADVVVNALRRGEAIGGVGSNVDGGIRVGFVTNNASRAPAVVAAQLTQIGVPAAARDVLTSAQAAARLIADHVPSGSVVLVVGSQHLVDEVAKVGMVTTRNAADSPAAVVQGYAPEATWDDLTEAAYALQSSATWIASNTDSTRPSDRGLVPGAGAAVAAVGFTVPQRQPVVAGKPEPTLMVEAARRLGAVRPIVVGDRLDTDMAGARAANMRSVLVLTGAHGKHDLVMASASERPGQVIADLRGIFGPQRRVRADMLHARVGAATVTADQGVAILDGPYATVEDQLDLLWALANLSWKRHDAGQPDLDCAQALRRLDKVR